MSTDRSDAASRGHAIEAARLTNEELISIVGKVRNRSHSDVLRSVVAVADAATAKALRGWPAAYDALVVRHGLVVKALSDAEAGLTEVLEYLRRHGHNPELAKARLLGIQAALAAEKEAPHA